MMRYGIINLLTESIEGDYKMAKQLNPNSGRQIVMKVLFDSGIPMTPGQISAKLKELGHEIKYLHSHLNYFKTHGQILHLEDKSYKISSKMVDRLEELYNTEVEEVVLIIEESDVITQEEMEELVEA
jgi:hypothetical protein